MAAWGGADEDVARLLARADAALYRAKDLGRDRVEAAARDLEARLAEIHRTAGVATATA